MVSIASLSLDFFTNEFDADITAAGFTDDFRAKPVWLGMQATLSTPHVAPTRLETLFAKGNGPEQLDTISNGSALGTITTKAT